MTISLEDQLVVALEVGLAAFLSAIIGLDRERLNKHAGLRTHILVGVGACLFTALSLLAFPNSETSRVAAQIVTGIGFLGAGAIIKEQNRVKGLTTAAAIWATAAVGMAIGVGAWLLAVIATLLIWFVLAVMIRIEDEIDKEESKKTVQRDQNP